MAGAPRGPRRRMYRAPPDQHGDPGGPILAPEPHAEQADGADGLDSLASLGSPHRSTSATRSAGEASAPQGPAAPLRGVARHAACRLIPRTRARLEVKHRTGTPHEQPGCMIGTHAARDAPGRSIAVEHQSRID